MQCPLSDLNVIGQHLRNIEITGERNGLELQRPLPRVLQPRPEFLIERTGVGQEGRGQDGVAHQTPDLLLEGAALQDPAQLLTAQPADE